jgi:haloalkane dehalogenase
VCFGGSLLSGCLPQVTEVKVAQANEACLAEPEVLTTNEGVAYVRTPDACFENLPDWPYKAKYLEIGGLRQAYVDVGPADGEPILLLHGQPSWSYLYRFMIPALVENGYRVIAMDHVGMGRSDKPVDLEYHSFENHVDRLDTFITELNLTNLTVFFQDWGSIIGLYLSSKQPDLFDRIILGNGGLPVIKEPYATPDDIDAAVAVVGQTISMIPPEQPAFFDEEGNSVIPNGEGNSLIPGADGGEGAGAGGASFFGQWITYAMYAEDFEPAKLVEALTHRALTPEELAGYAAPFPTRITMAGPRTFPSLINEMVGLSEPATEELTRYEKPFLTIFGANEPGVSPAIQGWFIDNVPGAMGQAHHRFPDASHFLQDDKGREIAERVVRFLADNPL